MEYFNKTCIGYSHIKNKKPCQDFSIAYHDEERTIVAVCDGHGGDKYIRSDRGSKFACEAVLNALKSLPASYLRKSDTNAVKEKLKLNVLTEWNHKVEEDLAAKKISSKELSALSDKDKAALRREPFTAYGTTLNGVMVIGKKLVTVQLGDGGCCTIKNGELEEVFPEEDEEQVANLTYSMCQSDAFDHLKVAVTDFKDADGVIICSDGVLNPYQNIPNFSKSFVNPAVRSILDGKSKSLAEFIETLGKEKGIGDDVSVGIILSDSIKAKYYS